MNISIYSKYKVNSHCKYSCQNEDGDWVDREFDDEQIIDGYKFIEIITRHLTDRDFIGIRTDGNNIYIENFDPMNGETANYKITYEEDTRND